MGRKNATSTSAAEIKLFDFTSLMNTDLSPRSSGARKCLNSKPISAGERARKIDLPTLNLAKVRRNSAAEQAELASAGAGYGDDEVIVGYTMQNKEPKEQGGSSMPLDMIGAHALMYARSAKAREENTNKTERLKTAMMRSPRDGFPGAEENASVRQGTKSKDQKPTLSRNPHHHIVPTATQLQPSSSAQVFRRTQVVGANTENLCTLPTLSSNECLKGREMTAETVNRKFVVDDEEEGMSATTAERDDAHEPQKPSEYAKIVCSLQAGQVLGKSFHGKQHELQEGRSNLGTERMQLEEKIRLKFNNASNRQMQPDSNLESEKCHRQTFPFFIMCMYT